MSGRTCDQREIQTLTMGDLEGRLWQSLTFLHSTREGPGGFKQILFAFLNSQEPLRAPLKAGASEMLAMPVIII